MRFPLSVVHVIGDLSVGGVERNLVRVLPRLDRTRFRVAVVCIRDRGALADDMEAAGVPVSFVYMKSRYHPGSLFALRDEFRRLQADIVQGHMRRANTSGRIAAMLAGVPVRIASERDMGLGKNWKHYWIDGWLGRYSDAILCVTKGVAEHERARSGLPADKFRVVYNGMDLERYANPPEPEAARQALDLPERVRGRRKFVGIVSRLDEIKNIDAVIRAFADPRLADVALLIVGDGGERERLERLTDELALRDRVAFLGFRTDLPLVYAAFDATVLASRSEGIANVQLEAMAAGVPLVSTPVGIAHEAMTPGRDYLEVASADPALLAGGIAEALTPDRAAALRAAGKAAVRDFGIDTQVRRMEAFYREILERRGVWPAVETESSTT